jgi:hypothetical protein
VQVQLGGEPRDSRRGPADDLGLDDLEDEQQGVRQRPRARVKRCV